MRVENIGILGARAKLWKMSQLEGSSVIAKRLAVDIGLSADDAESSSPNFGRRAIYSNSVVDSATWLWSLDT